MPVVPVIEQPVLVRPIPILNHVESIEDVMQQELQTNLLDVSHHSCIGNKDLSEKLQNSCKDDNTSKE